MAETLFRDTAREEYFYQLGSLEAFQVAKDTKMEAIYQVVVKHALEQVHGN